MTQLYIPDILKKAAFNQLGNIESRILMGRNQAISTAEETVWQPGTTYVPLIAAVAFEAVSASANDTAAGTGARTIEVELIDGNYAKSTVTVTMNGATPVAITGTFVACNSIKVVTAGSGNINAGSIDIRTVSGSVVKRRLEGATTVTPGDFNFIYTIPAGHIGLLSTIKYGVATSTGSLLVWLVLTESTGVFRSVGIGFTGLSNTSITDSNGEIFFGDGLYLPEKSCIDLRVDASAGVGDFAAQAQLLIADLSQGAGNFGIQ